LEKTRGPARTETSSPSLRHSFFAVRIGNCYFDAVVYLCVFSLAQCAVGFTFAAVSDYNAYIDGLILQALRNDDEQPLKHLFTHYYNRLFRTGLRYHANALLVEECIQEVFFDLWRYRQQLGAIESLEAYLKTSLRRRIFRQLNQPDPLQHSSDLSVVASAMDDVSYEDILIRQQTDQEQRQRLMAALDQLSSRQKEIVYLKYFEELSYKEIADQLNISIGAVYKLLHDSVKRLKLILRSE
jgi:RNA polymerase sigma factor (sigma-70 family)